MRAGFYTLGCKVNQYESQAMSEVLSEKGFEGITAAEFMGHPTPAKLAMWVMRHFEHYGIKAEGRELDEKLGRKLYNNIKVKRTENLGIKLTVWDTDPEYAANIANFMAQEIGTVRNDAKKVKYDSICAVIERSRNRILAEIDVLSDSLSKMSKEYKVYYPDGTSERFAQELAKQVAAGNCRTERFRCT